jgi:transposase
MTPLVTDGKEARWMLAWEGYVELRNLKERGWSISAIARHTGLDRKTIRRYLLDPDARPGERRSVQKLLDRFGSYVDARLEDNEHIDATVLLRELRELGYEGSYRTLARHLQTVRPACPVQGAGPAESVG